MGGLAEPVEMLYTDIRTSRDHVRTPMLHTFLILHQTQLFAREHAAAGMREDSRGQLFARWHAVARMGEDSRGLLFARGHAAARMGEDSRGLRLILVHS